MGVDIETYRARIGHFVHRRNWTHVYQEKLVPGCAEAESRITTGTVICFYVCTLTLLTIISSCCTTVIFTALSGGHVLPTRDVFASVPARGTAFQQPDLSDMILRAGDIEENPGPGLERADLDAAIKDLRDSMQKDLAKMLDDRIANQL